MHQLGRARPAVPLRPIVTRRALAAVPAALLLAEAAAACVEALPAHFHEARSACLATPPGRPASSRNTRPAIHAGRGIEPPLHTVSIPLPRAAARPHAAAPRAFAGPAAPLGHEVPFAADIVAAGLRHRIDPALLASLIEAESRFRADAVSPRGALGLTQVMPATARELGIGQPERLLTDPALAIDAGARYLRHLHARFGNDLPRVLAGYNAGPAAVARHGGIPPFAETRAYVGRVLTTYAERRRPAAGHGA